MFKHLRLIPFIVGLVIGIIGIFLINPTKNVIHKYPTPDTANKLIYKDKNGVCYKYNANEVSCDKNESRIKDFPITK